MRRKIKAIDPKELFDADDINRTTIKGEMRKLYPAIHQKLMGVGGKKWEARDMVKWLDERGVSMTVELFRVYLNNLDHENGYVRYSNTFIKDQEERNTPIGKGKEGIAAINPSQACAHTAPAATEKNKFEATPVSISTSSGKRKSILKQDKGMFGELNPSPVDGIVDLKQK